MSPRENSPEMSLALKRLCAERIRHKQTSDYQIKVGPYNFYPGKGTIFLDGDREARPERGIEAFIKMMLKLKERDPRLVERKQVIRLPLDRPADFDIREAFGDPSELTGGLAHTTSCPRRHC